MSSLNLTCTRAVPLTVGIEKEPEENNIRSLILFFTAYVVYGEAKVEDLNSQAQASAAEQYKAPEPAKAQIEDDEDVPELAEEEDGVDDEGVESKDIELVMQQAGVSRAKAVKALKVGLLVELGLR